MVQIIITESNDIKNINTVLIINPTIWLINNNIIRFTWCPVVSKSNSRVHLTTNNVCASGKDGGTMRARNVQHAWCLQQRYEKIRRTAYLNGNRRRTWHGSHMTFITANWHGRIIGFVRRKKRTQAARIIHPHRTVFRLTTLRRCTCLRTGPTSARRVNSN